MPDIESQTDEALVDLIRRAQFELEVRGALSRLAGLAPCDAIWGPGPPYYCIPRCKGGYKGHDGPCEPDMTKAEALEAWQRSSRSLIGHVQLVHEEARRRLNA